jgi:Lon protease-like protein
MRVASEFLSRVPAVVAALVISTAAATAQTIPSVLPLLSLEDGTQFPGISQEVQIIEPRSRIMVDEALKGDRIVGLVTVRPGSAPNERGWLDLFPVGTVCVIDDVSRMADGRLFIVLRGIVKFRIRSERTDRVYRSADIEPLPETVRVDEQETLRRLRVRVDELAMAADPIVLPEMPDEKRINALAFYMDLTLFERQDLLERDGLIARAQAMIDFLAMKLATPR